jgi:glycosyltransferase involved in cell wall biosynthesis
MNNVLMIVYFFPPLGSVQVLRALKFAKYLPEYGWNPLVLAVKDISHYYQDPALLNELPDSVVIKRTESLDPFRIMAVLNRHSDKKESNQKETNQRKFQSFRDNWNVINRWISLPDSRFGWYPFAVNTGRNLINDYNIKAIYSSCPPNICHLVALKLSQQTQLPWVADFKDMWSDYPHIHPTRLHRNIMLRWESKIIHHASSVITVNPGISHDLLERYPAFYDKIHTIVHGFDPEEQDNVNPLNFDKFTLVHTGSFFEPRQIPDYFLAAMAQWLKQKPSRRDNTQVLFIGTLNSRHKQLIQDMKLNDVVNCLGSMERKKVIQYQHAADGLILLVGDGKRSEIVLPAKTWEYLAAKRPVLCMAPAGVTRDLIMKHQAGMVVAPSDIQGIQNLLESLYQQYLQKDKISPYIPDYNQYDRRLLTGNLASILDKISSDK